MQFQMHVLYKIKLVFSENIFNVKINGAFSHNAFQEQEYYSPLVWDS